MRSIPVEDRARRDAPTSARLQKRWLCLTLLGIAALSTDARACARPDADTLGARIAAIACAEHERWYAPFIDNRGRLASVAVSESESLVLRDGTPAWQRVAQYWRNSGVRGAPPLAMGADCSVVDTAGSTPANAAPCSTLLFDTPWSAVFVSYVMTQAAAPGFMPSAAHIDYVRQAYRGEGPFRFTDPRAEAPAAGDLLCFVRTPAAVFGHSGLRAWLEDEPAGWLPMHCDVVVSTHDAHARIVGGNVVQSVAMRLLPINREGRFWDLPQRTAADAPCDPDRPADCNFNRQDWAVLLKLDPGLASGAPSASDGSCCTACPVPLPAGVLRCDANARASP